MSLKLNGATSGSIELDVPAAIGSDLNITIPATAGEVVVANTSGDVDLGGLTVSGSATDGSVNIDSSGRLLVGTSSALTGSLSQYSKFQVHGNTANAFGGYLSLGYGSVGTSLSAGADIGTINFTDTAAGQFASIRCDVDSSTGSGNYPGRLVFSTTANGASSPTERVRIDNAGRFFVPGSYNSTTAAAANLTTRPDGKLERSTSSKKYKTSIETIEDSYSDSLLNVRPVWFRSLCESDNPDWGYWGFVAEEVAEIDPRLVHWKTEEIAYDENGSVLMTPCDPEPEGVQYDRFVPHLLNLIKRQKEQIETQGAAIAALEAKVATLEANP